MMKRKRPHSITSPPIVLQKRPLAVRPAKALPLLPVSEMVRVEDLGEAVRARCSGPRLAGRHHGGQGREAQRRDAEVEHGEHRQLHLAASIFLPRYSGVRPTIRPAMNTARMANTSRPMMPTPDAAEDDLAEGDVEHGHAAGQRREAVVRVVHRAARGVGRDVAQRRVGDAEAHLLALHVAAGLGRGELSLAPPLARIGLPSARSTYITATLMNRITMAAANSAQPCRWLPAKRPNV